MTWVSIDDGLPDHPKILALGDDAPHGLAMYVAAICWSGKHATDGAIPAIMVPRLVPGITDNAHALADKLADVGLFERNDGGWELHDWHDYQRTKAEWDDLRRKRQEAGRRGGLARVAKQANAQANAQAFAQAQNITEQNITERETRAPASYSKHPTCLDVMFSDGNGGHLPAVDYITQVFERKFGMSAPTDYGEFWKHVCDGCLHGCPGKGKQLDWCIDHLELKINGKGAKTWRGSGLLRRALLEDRRDVTCK